MNNIIHSGTQAAHSDPPKSTRRPPPHVALQPACSDLARQNLLKGVRNPVALNEIAEHLTSGQRDELAARYPTGRIYLWGVKLERGSQWAKIAGWGAVILIRDHKDRLTRAVSNYGFINDALAHSLWGIDPDDGETWPLIYCLDKVQKTPLTPRKVNTAAGRRQDHWQGLTVLDAADSTSVLLSCLPEMRERRI